MTNPEHYFTFLELRDLALNLAQLTARHPEVKWYCHPRSDWPALLASLERMERANGEE